MIRVYVNEIKNNREINETKGCFFEKMNTFEKHL